MKILVIAATVLAPLISLAQNTSDKFVGGWRLVNEEEKVGPTIKTHKNLSIKEVHGTYYTSIFDMPEIGPNKSAHYDTLEMKTGVFKMKNGFLVEDNSKSKIVFDDKTGHLIWQGQEWVKGKK